MRKHFVSRLLYHKNMEKTILKQKYKNSVSAKTDTEFGFIKNY